MIKLQEHRNTDFLLFFNYGHTLFMTNKGTNESSRLLGRGSNIRDNILWNFFSSYFVKKRKKIPSQWPHILPFSCSQQVFLTQYINTSRYLPSRYLWQEDWKSISSLSFMFIIMIACMASLNKQWPHN